MDGCLCYFQTNTTLHLNPLEQRFLVVIPQAGTTALMSAAGLRDPAIVKLLVDSGARLDLTSNVRRKDG